MVPARPADFISRAPLSKLRRVLHRSQVAVVVTGMRGVGKTELAAAYARELLDTGDDDFLVAWVNAETRSTLLEGLAAVADRLDVADPDGDSLHSAQRLREHLSGRPQPGLLVLDNAVSPDTVKPFLPATSGTKVLITSTEQAFTTLGTALDLGVYNRSESLRYLRTTTDLTDNVGANAVAEQLGDLPLALTQAAATITHLGIDYPAYLALLDQPGRRAFTRLEGHEYPQQVLRAIQLSIDTAEMPTSDPALDTTVTDLLDLIAMLSPNGVARNLLPAYDGRRDEAVARCVQASLITRSADRSALVMHRLVARVLRDRADTVEARDRLLDNAVDAIAPHLFAYDQVWQRRDEGNQLIDHIDTLTDHAQPQMIRLFTVRRWASLQLTGAADLTRAVDHTQYTLTGIQNQLGTDHHYTLRAHSNLGFAYRSAERYPEAITLYEQLITDCERVLGPDHLDTLEARNDLADAYRSADRYEDAVPLYEQLIADRERVLGPGDPDTLRTRSNLGLAYQWAGRLEEAIALHEQLITDCERVLGPDHPDTLDARNALADAYRWAERYSDAITLYEQLIADRERVLGPDHPDTLHARNDLTDTYDWAGQADKAITLYEQLIADRERVLGPDHPDTLRTRSNLADAYRSADRDEDAVLLYEQLIADRERVLGPDHPDTLRARGDLAFTYRWADQLTDAITLYEQLIADRERVLGPDHPDTLRTRSNLADAYRSADRDEDAVLLYEQLIADSERVLGPDHPDTLQTRSDLGSAHRSADRDEDAVLLYEQLIADRERVLGPGHLDTLRTRSNLADAYRSADRDEDAVLLYEQLIADCERILGPDHPFTCTVRDGLTAAKLSDKKHPEN